MKYIGKQIVHCTIPGPSVHRDNDMYGASDVVQQSNLHVWNTRNIVGRNIENFTELLGGPIVISLSLKVISFVIKFFLEAMRLRSNLNAER